jgi:hypothetical protein
VEAGVTETILASTINHVTSFTLTIPGEPVGSGRPRSHASERPATFPSRLMTTKKGKKGYSRKNKHKGF